MSRTRIKDIVDKLLNSREVKDFSGDRVEKEKFLLSLIFRRKYPYSYTKYLYDFIQRCNYEKYVSQVGIFEKSFNIMYEDSQVEHGVTCFLIEDIQSILGLSNPNLDVFLTDVKMIVGSNVKFVYCSFKWNALSEYIQNIPFAFTPEVLSMYDKKMLFYTVGDFSYQPPSETYPLGRDSIKPNNIVIFFEGYAQEKLRRLLNLEFAENGNLIIFLRKEDYKIGIGLILSNSRERIVYIKESFELIMIHVVYPYNKNAEVKLELITEDGRKKEIFVNSALITEQKKLTDFFYKIKKSWFKDYLEELKQEDLIIKNGSKLSDFLWLFYQRKVLDVDIKNQKIKFRSVSLAGYISIKYKEIMKRSGYSWNDLAMILNNGSDLKGNIKNKVHYKENVLKNFPSEVDEIDSIFKSPNIKH